MGRSPTVAPSIADEVKAALRAAYPKHLIMTQPIVSSSMRLAERPMTAVFEGETDRAIARAAARLAKLRESAQSESA